MSPSKHKKIPFDSSFGNQQHCHIILTKLWLMFENSHYNNLKNDK
jgi:hypothetical protein